MNRRRLEDRRMVYLSATSGLLPLGRGRINLTAVPSLPLDPQLSIVHWELLPAVRVIECVS